MWYKDAILYQTHVKAFFDSANDGIGDFKGLSQKLDYLENLGITALWLMPFYPSPLKDDGYDISDYYNIHPSYGTLKDFKLFLKAAHDRNIRVITELVINHTSDQNHWFQRSRKAPPGSSFRDFYVWSSSPERYKEARIIFKDFEYSNWTYDQEAKAYYWHRFYSHQPDLNFDNPLVQKEVFKVMEFWFKMGVDGMRLDAVPYLFEKEGTSCENLPETHAFLKKLRKQVDSHFSEKMLLAEANQWPEDAVTYFGKGDECHMAFHFPLMPRIFMAVQMEDSFPVVDIFDQTPSLPANCQWATFLRNHDELTLEMVTDEERDYMYRMYARDPKARINLGIRRRLAPLLNNNRRKIELLNFLLFSLPGTPVIYYGEEIGMGDNYYLGDRNGVRTPMQWSSDKNAGFSKVNPQKLYLPMIIDPEYHFETVNVENQERNLSSLLWWMRRMIAMRKKYPSLSRGNMEFIGGNNSKVLAFVRKYEEEIILAVINLSRFTQPAELKLEKFSGFIPEEVFGQQKFPLITEKPYLFTLGSYDHFWLRLFPQKVKMEILSGHTEISLDTKQSWMQLFFQYKSLFEKDVLKQFILKSRWFGGKNKKISQITIENLIPVGERNKYDYAFLFIQVRYTEGEPEIYSIPVGCAANKFLKKIISAYPEAVITLFKKGKKEYLLMDAFCDRGFLSVLLKIMFSGNPVLFQKKKIFFEESRLSKQAIKKILIQQPKILKREQSNSSAIVEPWLFFKMYRKTEEDVNPETEILSFLNHQGYKNIPEYLGSFVLYDEETESKKLLFILQSFIESQGDAWSLTINESRQYYERLLIQKNENISPSELPKSLFDTGYTASNETAKNLIGILMAERAKLLGIRTAELHLALADSSGNPDFCPEPFTVHYQRSIYQSIRTSIRKTIENLKTKMGSIPPSVQPFAIKVIESESLFIRKIEELFKTPILAMKIRIHGDYHLGQVLYNGKDFFIIDFEGEPLKSFSERKLKRSALRDVAGMFRSFHYAAYFPLLKSNFFRSEDLPYLRSWVFVWYEHVIRYFIRGYKQRLGASPLLPQNTLQTSYLLEAYLLEKNFYEIDYELNHRPEWLHLPLQGIMDLLDHPLV